jgi:hypothetical protein
MVVMVMVALAVVLCAAVEGASAQACVPFRGSPHTGGKCDALVTYPNVLLRPNQTYEQVGFLFFFFVLFLYCPSSPLGLV